MDPVVYIQSKPSRQPELRKSLSKGLGSGNYAVADYRDEAELVQYSGATQRLDLDLNRRSLCRYASVR